MKVNGIRYQLSRDETGSLVDYLEKDGFVILSIDGGFADLAIHHQSRPDVYLGKIEVDQPYWKDILPNRNTKIGLPIYSFYISIMTAWLNYILKTVLWKRL